MSGRAYPYSGKTERPNPPLSALEAFADQLQQRGVKRVEGNIVGDDTAFPARALRKWLGLGRSGLGLRRTDFRADRE